MQSLTDHSLVMLRIIAELRGVALQSQEHRGAVEELAVALADPASIAQALCELSPEATAALEELVAAGGRMPSRLFLRRYGEIRPFGPGRLAREQPWRSPTSPAEELWYRGWIFRRFAEIDEAPAEIVFVPDEVLALLPRQPARTLNVPMAAVPDSFLDSGDALVQDATTLLAMVQVEGMRRQQGRWRPEDLSALSARLLVREATSASSSSGSRLAFLLHLAEQLDWIREDGKGNARLHASAVHTWLQSNRAEQWQMLWLAWQDSEAWDDLRRLPGLVCEGSWRNDPIGARRRFLAWLEQLQPGSWHEVGAWISALKTVAPNFLRPDGDYDSWYIRPVDGDRYLRGFEHWDDVEARLAHFLITGPLHWLGAIALDTEGRRMAVTVAGQALIRAELPPTASPDSILVGRDFSVLVPLSAPAFDRFRVARFASWEASPIAGSAEPFRYRITRTSLRRAEAQGITAERVLAFLQDRVGDALPDNVARALMRWSGAAKNG
ncbi:MAG: helicase-associated domain-containing protein [Anaerolineae bacterium]|nr:helicase-associated domain-containing protein [Anaerolineae bacterium]